jgi:orotate phosphoribosyltransferase
MIFDKEFANELALDLLKINAVVLRPNEPFTWASGWKSPIYCDNRLTLRYPKIRKKIAQAFAAIVKSKFAGVDVITGTATAGIPHAAWVAADLDLPMAYVRAKAKNHGMTNQIEGGVAKGERAVIIEDLISTGGSAKSVAEVINIIDAKVMGICSIFTYGFDEADKLFNEAGIITYSLTNYNTLLEIASANDYIKDADQEILAEWRKNPSTWPSK